MSTMMISMLINNDDGTHRPVPLLAAGQGPGVHEVHGPDVLVAAVHYGLTGHRIMRHVKCEGCETCLVYV